MMVKSSDAPVLLHFVDPDTKARADYANICASIGYHCELYADFSELSHYPPKAGILVISDRSELFNFGHMLDRLMQVGIWLPVVIIGDDPSPPRVVKAIKDGALDYLALPLRPNRLEACLQRVKDEAAEIGEERRRRFFAQQSIGALTTREREVLEELIVGGTNKEIGRRMQLSPRTVEIHRSNMMNKLGARHPAEAIRIRFEFGRVTLGARVSVGAC